MTTIHAVTLSYIAHYLRPASSTGGGAGVVSSVPQEGEGGRGGWLVPEMCRESVAVWQGLESVEVRQSMSKTLFCCISNAQKPCRTSAVHRGLMRQSAPAVFCCVQDGDGEEPDLKLKIGVFTNDGSYDLPDAFEV